MDKGFRASMKAPYMFLTSTAFTKAPIPAFAIGNSGTALSMNDAFMLLTGYQSDESHTLTPQDIFPPETASIIQELAGSIDNTIAVKEIDILDSRGKPVSIQAKIIMDADEKGEPYFIFYIISYSGKEDFSGSHSGNNDVRDSVICSFDAKGTLRSWPRGFEMFFGLQSADAVGSKIWDVLTASLANREVVGDRRKRIASFFEKGTIDILPQFLSDYYKNSKHIRFLSSTVFSLGKRNGGGEIFGLHMEDITERKIAEESLRRSEKMYRSLVENLDLGISFVGEDGTILFSNTALRRMKRKPSADKYEKYCFITSDYVTSPCDKCPGRKAMISGGSVEEETRGIDANNEPAYFRVKAFPVSDDEGVNSGYIELVENITERKKQEEERRGLIKQLQQQTDELSQLNSQLVQSEKELLRANNTKDKFFSIIAHDLRSPFSAFLGFAEILALELDTMSKEDAQEIVEKNHLLAREVFALIENLLDWARIQLKGIRINPVTLDVADEIHKVSRLSKPGLIAKNIDLVLDLQPDISVFIDKNMFHTIIRNILSNALKFTPSGGIIKCRAYVQNGKAICEISDTGLGMDSKTIEKILNNKEHFSTRGTDNEKGTGLGLLLVKEFIELNKGTLSISSKEGEGTTFTLAFSVLRL